MKIEKHLLGSIMFGFFCAIGFFALICGAYYNTPDVTSPTLWEKILGLWFTLAVGGLAGAFWYGEMK